MLHVFSGAKGYKRHTDAVITAQRFTNHLLAFTVNQAIERRAYEIALVSLEAEPVAWLHSDNGLGIPAITRSKNIADSWLSKGWYVQPLYIAKPVPMVPDVRPSLNNGIVGFDEGWNACRAAMLSGGKS